MIMDNCPTLGDPTCSHDHLGSGHQLGDDVGQRHRGLSVARHEHGKGQDGETCGYEMEI